MRGIPKGKEEAKKKAGGIRMNKEKADEIKETILGKTNWGNTFEIAQAIDLTISETEKALICSKCGFPKGMPRNIVFLDDNLLSYLEHEENICKGCGHQKDGWTIPAVQVAIRRAVEETKKRRMI